MTVNMPDASLHREMRQRADKLHELAIQHEDLQAHLDRGTSKIIIAIHRHDSEAWTDGPEDSLLWIKGNRVREYPHNTGDAT